MSRTRQEAEVALENAPRRRFASLPTPVERLDTLAEELGIDLWVKRDDLSGTTYGGNKTRKLEFLLADALEQGHDEVWTVGAIGSNHVLATCLWGTELGLECGALHFPQPVTEHVLHNLRALSTTHPNLHLIGHRAQLPVEMFKVKLKEWLNTNPGVYYIPGGGSSPVGVLGYVAAAFELVDQYAEMDEPLPDVVVVAAGTCGTFSGLRLGFELAEVPIRVIGVRVVDKIVANVPLATHLANRTAALMEDYGAGELPRLRHADIEILDGFLGDDYGVPTASGLRAIQRMERADGLHLEPTYTGKAFGALLDRVRDFRGRRVLYWHTLSSADLGARIDASNVARDLPDEYMDYFEELA